MEKTQIKQTTINNPNRTNFSVSTVFIFKNYETMVFDKYREYIEESHTTDKDEAIKQHNKFVSQYTQKVEPPVKLIGKYFELADDLKLAAEKAKPLGHTEDGGTCNFDSLELKLPRYNEKQTIAAIEAAGLRGYKTKIFSKITVYIITPPVCMQANARTRQAEKMRDIMKRLGYQASVYYMMD